MGRSYRCLRLSHRRLLPQCRPEFLNCRCPSDACSSVTVFAKPWHQAQRHILIQSPGKMPEPYITHTHTYTHTSNTQQEHREIPRGVGSGCGRAVKTNLWWCSSTRRQQKTHFIWKLMSAKHSKKKQNKLGLETNVLHTHTHTHIKCCRLQGGPVKTPHWPKRVFVPPEDGNMSGSVPHQEWECLDDFSLSFFLSYFIYLFFLGMNIWIAFITVATFDMFHRSFSSSEISWSSVNSPSFSEVVPAGSKAAVPDIFFFVPRTGIMGRCGRR